MTIPVLEIRKLRVSRAGVIVLRDISLHVGHGEIVALIGPNGAGKSSLLGAVMGLHQIVSGEIDLTGNSIRGLKPEQISQRISLIPEEGAVFPFLTVMENLWVSKGSSKEALAKDSIFNVFPVLDERRDHEACTLSGGQRQMLALGVGLVRDTAVLLLDEPSLGLAPIMVSRIFDAIARISTQYNLSILVSEQTPRILDIAHRAYVIEGGQIRMEGDAHELKSDERIQKVYLGIEV